MLLLADAPPTLVDKWNAYVRNLTLHEEGHVDNIAESYLDVRTAIQGATCPTAEAQAQATLEVIGQFDRDYDRDTDHGATQGAVFP